MCIVYDPGFFLAEKNLGYKSIILIFQTAQIVHFTFKQQNGTI